MNNYDRDTPQNDGDENRSQIAVTNDDLARERAQTKRENDRQDEQANRREKVTLWVAVAGVLIAAASTGISWFQWDLMRQQLRDARESSKSQDQVTARTISALERQLEATDRPWIAVDFSSAVIRFQPGGEASFNAVYTLKNVGRSPAANIELFAQLVALPPNDWITGPLSQQNTACKPRTASATDLLGFSLFPDEAMSDGFGSSLNAQQMSNANVQPPPGVAGRYFKAVLVGCVAYTFANSTKVHTTRFAYDINRRRPNDPHPALLEVGRSLVGDEIVLTRFYFGGANAN